MEKYMKAFLFMVKVTVFLFCFILIMSLSSWGEDTGQLSMTTTLSQKLNLIVGKSVIIESAGHVKRVSLASPDVADAVVLTTHQIYLTGKQTGVTNLTLWENSKVSAIYDIEVLPDISRLKKNFHELFPGEEIKVTATHDNITLSGTVSNAGNIPQILALAAPYVEKPEYVINLLEVGGVQQVMLEVRVAEMSRSVTKRLGFNFNYISNSGRNIGISLLNDLSGLPTDGWPSNALEVANPINFLFTFFGEGTSWMVLMDALKERGLVRILAEPTIITLSGQKANFLAGGEFPIPVPQDLGRTTIQYKEFGVGLNFTPTVLSDKKINIQVAPEVSDLDFSNAVVFAGFVIPSITTRRVSTVIELADGQSFAIAGLLQNNVREVVSKFPVLGDIPVLGNLFRSSEFQKNETELIIIVTPHLVKPLDRDKQPLPIDQYIEPSDFEFYLLGAMEGKEKVQKSAESSAATSDTEYTNTAATEGFEGEFGHIIPD
jgi:pilus assembly protein CpaC